MKIVSSSPDATEAFAVALARFIVAGDFVSLHGELGAGKTKFSSGIAKGLGVDHSIPVTSPTYTLLNIYHGEIPLYHFDLYRLAGDDDVVTLGFHEYFSGDGVCLVEWAERLKEELPGERLDIFLTYISENSRQIELVATCARMEKLILLVTETTKNIKNVKFF
ncbi:MAG: tRNA (adenosine(37)-N6)-threonylcarbamoyltransferase complex ATPase subunit type 1 TsaE [Geobacteraceae bacterium]|nr:tRNA (adenosine(37)-N6)-threonylcarbamoyltransferase complex ATPase subunit type 1 TsaE [Geobacteraceae bacterium]